MRKQTKLEALKAARKLIQKAWVQGTFEEELSFDDEKNEGTYAYCALGAVNFVDGPHEKAIKKLLDKHVPAKFKEERGWRRDWIAPGDCVMSYNDAKDTTKRKILAVFNRAVKELEGR